MTPSRAWPDRLHRIGWLAVWVAAACTDSTQPVELTPNATSVAVDADSGSLFRTLKVALSSPAGVQVDYWTEGSPRLRVTQPSVEASHSVFLPGLRAGSTYEYEVRSFTRGLALTPPFQGQLVTDTLPSDVAGLRLTAVGAPTQRLTMLEVRGTPFTGYAIVDRDLNIVWFRRGIGQSFTRRSNGNFVLLDRNPGLTEVRPDLTVVDQLPSTAERLMHHDVITTPANTLLFLAQDAFEFDGETWVGDAIWEWSPEAGTVERRWAARDFLSPMRDLGPKSVPGDWLHANSLSLGPRGNVLISLPALNQIISIAPDFRSLEWRLGGPNATIVPDAESEFWFEHTAAEVSTDRILMFDNGRDRPAGLFSRALELQLDRSRGTAITAWQFRPKPDIYAPVIGSARRLPNGHTVIDFGTGPGVLGSSGPVSVYDVSATSRVAWRLVVDEENLLNYRATPLQEIAGETVVPARY